MRLILQSSVVIASFIFIFIWEQSFAGYTIQALGFLIFLYLITSARKKGFNLVQVTSKSYISIFVLNTVIFLLIFSTGNITSPLFFLLYFLGFGISFIFDPTIVFVFAIGSFLVFLPESLKNDMVANFIKTGSLSLIAPLAFFFGKEFRQLDEEESHVEELKQTQEQAADQIAKSVGEVLEDEKKVIKEEAVEKLNNVLEETESLRNEK